MFGCLISFILGGWIGFFVAACLSAARDKPKPGSDVVHCKECKHNVANMETDPWDDTDYEDIVCLHWMSDGCGPNDFCSRGERRNDG